MLAGAVTDSLSPPMCSGTKGDKQKGNWLLWPPRSVLTCLPLLIQPQRRRKKRTSDKSCLFARVSNVDVIKAVKHFISPVLHVLGLEVGFFSAWISSCSRQMWRPLPPLPVSPAGETSRFVPSSGPTQPRGGGGVTSAGLGWTATPRGIHNHGHFFLKSTLIRASFIRPRIMTPRGGRTTESKHTRRTKYNQLRITLFLSPSSPSLSSPPSVFRSTP